jgi:hypothetical protein
MKEEATADRREFFKSCMRSVSLGILTLGGGALALRKQDMDDDHECIHRGICRGCGVFNSCRLPQALSAKENQHPVSKSKNPIQMRPADVSGQE